MNCLFILNFLLAVYCSELSTNGVSAKSLECNTNSATSYDSDLKINEPNGVELIKKLFIFENENFTIDSVSKNKSDDSSIELIDGNLLIKRLIDLSEKIECFTMFLNIDSPFTDKHLENIYHINLLKFEIENDIVYYAAKTITYVLNCEFNIIKKVLDEYLVCLNEILLTNLNIENPTISFIENEIKKIPEIYNLLEKRICNCFSKINDIEIEIKENKENFNEIYKRIIEIRKILRLRCTNKKTNKNEIIFNKLSHIVKIIQENKNFDKESYEIKMFESVMLYQNARKVNFDVFFSNLKSSPIEISNLFFTKFIKALNTKFDFIDKMLEIDSDKKSIQEGMKLFAESELISQDEINTLLQIKTAD